MDTCIKIYKWKSASAEERRKILRRSEADVEDVTATVIPIIEDVRKRGDTALVHYAKKLDGAEIDPGGIKAGMEEFDYARSTLDGFVKRALETCIANVRKHHESQYRRAEKFWLEEVAPGILAGEKITPIPSVGIYAPCGRNPYPSALYMLAIAAKVAGVPEIHIVSPPGSDGKIDAAALYSAELAGVHNVYKAGGAQAIAALAFGTETIPKVAKVVGPGNAYVAAAKRVLSSVIDPGMPAGPTDAIVVADGEADPENTALDILNEAEHGNDSASILVTSDEDFAQKVAESIRVFIEDLPQPSKETAQNVLQNYGGIIVTENDDEAVEFCNTYAPEHLYLNVRRPDDWLPRLLNAGEIIIGPVATLSMANYGIGANHVLPTGGHARTYSCTSIWDFLKRTSVVKMERKGFDALKKPVSDIAMYERFPAHANSILKRKL